MSISTYTGCPLLLFWLPFSCLFYAQSVAYNCSVTLANICRYRSLFCSLTNFMSILCPTVFDHQFYSMIAAYRAYLCLFNSTNCHLSTLHYCNTWQPWRISWVKLSCSRMFQNICLALPSSQLPNLVLSMLLLLPWLRTVLPDVDILPKYFPKYLMLTFDTIFDSHFSWL